MKKFIEFCKARKTVLFEHPLKKARRELMYEVFALYFNDDSKERNLYFNEN